MPESLFMRRPPRRGRFVLMVVGSVLFHYAIVGVGAIFTRDTSWDIPTPPVELELADKLGDPDVRELIVADTPPPEDQPTPPPDETPPPDDTPPPQVDPDMVDPEQTPPPETPKPSVKPYVKRSTPPPANAKRGPIAQEGVVGGNPNGTKTTGTPGAKVVGHWTTPKPPYPQQARMAKLQGSGSLRISTDASGNVSSVSIGQSAGSPILDNAIQSYARNNWKGPPNASTTVPFTFTQP